MFDSRVIIPRRFAQTFFESQLAGVRCLGASMRVVCSPFRKAGTICWASSCGPGARAARPGNLSHVNDTKGLGSNATEKEPGLDRCLSPLFRVFGGGGLTQAQTSELLLQLPSLPLFPLLSKGQSERQGPDGESKPHSLNSWTFNFLGRLV